MTRLRKYCPQRAAEAAESHERSGTARPASSKSSSYRVEPDDEVGKKKGPCYRFENSAVCRRKIPDFLCDSKGNAVFSRQVNGWNKPSRPRQRS